MKIFEIATLGAVALIAAVFLMPASSSASVAPASTVTDSASSTVSDWMFTVSRAEFRAYKRAEKAAFKSYRKSIHRSLSTKAERREFCRQARAARKSLNAVLRSSRALIGTDASPSDLPPAFMPFFGV